MKWACAALNPRAERDWTRHNMHFNFDFTTAQVLWTLTLAALLVLLVVLLGRDRARRFPFFTASIALVALRLLMNKLLYGKLPMMTMGEVFITLADLTALVALLVLAEMARRAFDGLQRSLWIANSVGLLAVAGTVLAVWGPWPAWKTLTADSHLAALRLMQLVAEKGDLLAILLTVGLGVLVVLFGRRYKAGWRSHTQRIVIGLSTAAIAQLVLLMALERIMHTAAPQNRAEYEHLLSLRDKLINADGAVYVVVLVWWIWCLWIDEPGANSEAAAGSAEE
jgi:asparagine N-glycosylation enzyme membrane subunit Stt3